MVIGRKKEIVGPNNGAVLIKRGPGDYYVKKKGSENIWNIFRLYPSCWGYNLNGGVTLGKKRTLNEIVERFIW